MPNIKFNYLYRDSANYKKLDWVIFKNDLPIGIDELETLIRSKLIDGQWFYADQWQLPEIFLASFDFKIDPTWHEFESVEYTDGAANSAITFSEFIQFLKNINGY